MASQVVDSVRHAKLPSGGSFGSLLMPDGWPLRVARWPGARGTLLVAGGRGDFIEKYGEAYRHWTDLGWSVLAFDWRGQGGSGRLGATLLHGAPGPFARWVRDLQIVIGSAIAEGPRPVVAIGHSMGGHLLLRALAEGEARLQRAVLNAPMLGIRTSAPGWVTPAVVRAGIALGFGPRFAPGQGPNRAGRDAARRLQLLTHDAERGAEEYALLDLHPDLALGGPTWGWLGDAFRSMRRTLAPGGLESVRTPVLVLTAGDDRVVDNAAARAAVARLPRGDYVEIAGAAHELWREADPLRGQAMAAIDSFLEQL